MAILSKYFGFIHNFILQWHITERCNWHCKHCYREKNYVKELPLKKLYSIFFQYLDLLKALNVPKGHGRLNITGGEPFIRKDFFDFLKFIHSHNKGQFTVGILSNGSFVTKENIGNLKSMGVKRFQLSLEGMKDINDSIRGKGSFDKIIETAQLLINADIQTAISFTLTRENVADIPELAKLCDDLGVSGLGIRRFVPIGRGRENKLNILSPKELKETYYLKKEIRQDLRRRERKIHVGHGCENGIFTDDTCKGWCGVIEGRCLTLFPNGDVLACRRLPIIVGNVLEKSLLDIYFSSDKLWQFRNLNNAHPLCRKCKDFKSCRGGALCISYAYFNKFSVPDPQCWRVFKELPPGNFFKGRIKKNPYVATFYGVSSKNEN